MRGPPCSGTGSLWLLGRVPQARPLAKHTVHLPLGPGTCFWNVLDLTSLGPSFPYRTVPWVQQPPAPPSASSGTDPGPAPWLPALPCHHCPPALSRVCGDLGSSCGTERQGKARPEKEGAGPWLWGRDRDSAGGPRGPQTDFGPLFRPLFQTKGKEGFPCWTQTTPTTCSSAWRRPCPALRTASRASTWVRSGALQGLGGGGREGEGPPQPPGLPSAPAWGTEGQATGRGCVHEQRGYTGQWGERVSENPKPARKEISSGLRTVPT